MGNPYNNASNITKVGTIAVSANGSFSVKNVKSTYVFTKASLTQVITTMVTGKFETARSASGTITFTEKWTAPGLNHSCPAHLTFTATTKQSTTRPTRRRPRRANANRGSGRDGLLGLP
jgi:hypothetical protein